MQNRTDLALELKEEKNIGSAESGIIVKTRIDTANHIKETKILIQNKKGERSLGKPKGSYITIEAGDLSSNDGSFHKEMSEALFLNLRQLLGKRKKILIAGLGNANVTADSLGPKVVNNLCITRHLQKEGIGKYQFELSAIAPGVMAQTGIETSEILESLAAKIKPDVLIAIDALAARSSSRLNKTIQISDTGIAPGSGVGNHRNEITEHTIGVPVFAGFSGGAQVLVNYTGGFIWGFIFMAALCGVGSVMKNKVLGFVVGMAGLAICHLLGVLQFMVVMGMGFGESFALVSAPYLIKDVISVILAFVVGGQIRKRLIKANLL